MIRWREERVATIGARKESNITCIPCMSCFLFFKFLFKNNPSRTVSGQTMVVVKSDRYEENYELISSTQCIIFKKILSAKNTVFLVELVPCRCQSQP